MLTGAMAGGAAEDGNSSSEVDDLVKRLVFWVGLEDSGADVSGTPRLPKEAGSCFVPGNLAPIMFVAGWYLHSSLLKYLFVYKEHTEYMDTHMWLVPVQGKAGT